LVPIHILDIVPKTVASNNPFGFAFHSDGIVAGQRTNKAKMGISPGARCTA